MSNYTSHKIKGLLSMFALVTVATLAAPYTALGAGRGAGNSGSVGMASPSRGFSHGFRHGRFFDGDGFDGDGFGGGDVTVEQSQPGPTVAPEPPVNRRYVQPRWVDGGYGVQVLEPGYWVSTDK